MHKWFQAIHLLCSAKKGISSHQLHRILEVHYNTAWFMSHRIREAMRVGGLCLPWVATVASSRWTRRSMVVQQRIPKVVDRGQACQRQDYQLGPQKRNPVACGAWWPSSQLPHRGQHRRRSDPHRGANVSHEAEVMTDKAQLYKRRLSDRFASHDRVDHSEKEYARYEEGRPTIHTNTVEGYFSVFKRGMRGMYQHCKRKAPAPLPCGVRFSLQQPLKAFGVEDKERATKAVIGAKGKRLTYRNPNGSASPPENGRVSGQNGRSADSLSACVVCLYAASFRSETSQATKRPK